MAILWCVGSIVTGLLIGIGGGFGLGVVAFKNPTIGAISGGIGGVLIVLGFGAGIIGMC